MIGFNKDCFQLSFSFILVKMLQHLTSPKRFEPILLSSIYIVNSFSISFEFFFLGAPILGWVLSGVA